MKVGSNREINKDQKLISPEYDKAEGDGPTKKSRDKSDNLAIQDNNQKMLAKKDDDKKLAITLLIVGAGLIVYFFW